MNPDNVITVVVLAIAAFFALRVLAWNKIKALGARSWPLSEGRIEFGTVMQHDTRYFTYYSAQLAYSYHVNGEYYSGFHNKLFLRESSAERFVAELKGKPTFVRTKPNNADVSTILREDQQSVWPVQT